VGEMLLIDGDLVEETNCASALSFGSRHDGLNVLINQRLERARELGGSKWL
jgi:hypothetical protein